MANFNKFNNPKYLLSMLDADGEKPEIFIDCQNRGSGKTYGYSYGLLEQALGNDMGWGLPLGKFMIICRWKHEVPNIARGMFADVIRNEYEDATLNTVTKAGGLYSDIVFQQGDNDPVDVGYVVPVNKSDDLKKFSAMFSDTAVMIMDEFQCASMTSYCPDEMGKFYRLHVSVARGNGKSSRYVPVILLSNSISIMNPYFTKLGIHKRICSDTKKLKGTGYVLQRIVNPNAAKEQKESRFNLAFGDMAEASSSIDNTWLNDSESCIEKPKKDWGRSVYYYTLIKGENRYGVRFYPGMDLWTISNSVDASCQFIYNLTLSDGNLNYPLLKSSPQMKYLRDAFLGGQMRFPNQECKEIALDILI